LLQNKGPTATHIVIMATFVELLIHSDFLEKLMQWYCRLASSLTTIMMI